MLSPGKESPKEKEELPSLQYTSSAITSIKWDMLTRETFHIEMESITSMDS